ncbi:MAG: hypothetical protein ACE5E4_13610 [Candidatus Binatia bacterium]
MEARDALRIVMRARRKGMTDEQIAGRVYCSTQTFRDWGLKPDTVVSKAIEAHMRALLEELRAKKVKGGK